MTGLGIHSNVGSLTAQSNLRKISRAMQQSIGRLSSGLRIRSAADDPAGFAVATKMDARLRGYRQALRNANDAISLLQVAESSYQTQSDLISRMRELAVQAANDSLSDTERGYLDTELQQLKTEMARVAITSEFNGIPLAGGGGPVVSLSFQVGPDGGDAVSVDLPSLDPSVLGLGTTHVTTILGAQTAIDDLDGAMTALAGERAELGSAVGLMTRRVDHIQRTLESYGAALSQIRDADLAAESAALARTQVLQQAAVAMLAQANAQPNLILRLLG